MAWYRAGSVTVTQGSAVVNGAGTDFVSNTSVGEAFLGADGRVYEIVQVVSATQIVLGAAYQGASAGGQGFAVLPTQSFARDLALGAAQLLNTFAVVRDGIGAGLFPDGSLAAPGFRFAADQDTGWRRSGSNEFAVVTGGVDRVYFSMAGIEVSGRMIGASPDAVGVAAPPLGTIPASTSLFATNNARVYGLLVGQYGNTGDTWMQSQRIDGNPVAFNLNLQPSGGRVGIGTPSPTSLLHVSGSNATQVTIENTTGSGDNALVFKVPGKQWNVGVNIGASGIGSFNFYDVLRGTAVMTLDSGGNLLVGATLGNTNVIRKAASIGSPVLSIQSGTGFQVANFNVSDGTGADGANAANASLKLGSAGTGRSIAAAGTINAGGADYAEYVRKAENCGTILKGDVCGINSSGELVRTWADMVRPVVKSTDPSLVGGDVWAGNLTARPDAPIYQTPAYEGPAEPVEPVEPTPYIALEIETPAEVIRAEDETDDAFLQRLAANMIERAAAIDARNREVEAREASNAALGQYLDDMRQYRTDRDAFQAATADHAEVVATAEADHRKAMDDHTNELATWEASLEEARGHVDRIAFSGQVPVNVDEATLKACEFGLADGVAVYLVAVARGPGIGVAAVREEDMTLPLYMKRLGVVWAIHEGRPWIDVQHG